MQCNWNYMWCSYHPRSYIQFASSISQTHERANSKCYCFFGSIIKNSNNVKPSISTTDARFSREFEQMECIDTHIIFVWMMLRAIDSFCGSSFSATINTLTPALIHARSLVCAYFQFLSMPKLTVTRCVRMYVWVCDDGCTSWQRMHTETNKQLYSTTYHFDGRANFTMYSSVACSKLVHRCYFLFFLFAGWERPRTREW